MKLLPTIAMLLLPLSAAADTCDQKDAADRVEKAISGGVMAGYSMMNNTPTLHVTARDWATYPLEVRLGMFATFECAVAGPGGGLRVAQIVDEGGRVLATWDGMKKQIDVR